MKQFTLAELTMMRDAAEREIAARTQQIDVLQATLSELIRSNAPDAAIERVIEAIEIIDGATPTPAEIAPADDDTDTADDDIEPDDTEPRQEFIRHTRSLGYRGAGFDALLTAYHRDMAEIEWQRAENETRGHMVKSEYANGSYTVTVVREIENSDGTTSKVACKETRNGYDTRRFWFCNDRELRKYASEELLTWFDNNGRLTRAKLRASILGGSYYAGSGYYN